MHTAAGLSISHVRRPGLSTLSPGLASNALNKSCGLVCPYLSNQWFQNKVWPINSHLHFTRSSFLRLPYTLKKSFIRLIKRKLNLFKNGTFGHLRGRGARNSGRKRDLSIFPPDLSTLLQTSPGTNGIPKSLLRPELVVRSYCTYKKTLDPIYSISTFTFL